MNGIIRIVAALICVAAFSVPNAAAQLSSGIWMDRDELRSLPMSGAAWTNLKAAADQSCGTPDLSNQEDPANVCVMAKALVFARTGTESYRTSVETALTSIVNSGTYDGRSLALGLELAAYVISADLIGLAAHNPSLDSLFRSKIAELKTTYTHSGPGNIRACYEQRPNNWGTLCGASVSAVDAYLGDTVALERDARVLRGWLGDRSAYAGFSYGDLWWQSDPSNPVGINPVGATIQGHDVDGVLPDDQRRGGSFAWPPSAENYVYSALQGVLANAIILERAGYDVWNWESQAIRRAFVWLHEQANFPAEGDDEWQPHVVNAVYGTSFPAVDGARAGKNVGWTDWTHSGAASSCSYSLSPTSATLPAAGGGTQANVTTSTGCSWTAASGVSWVALGSSGRTGSGSVIATVAANSSTTARTGTLTIAGRTFTVNQEGGSCTYSLSASGASVAAAGGSGSVGVTASGSSCSWTATSGATWVTVSPASGSGGATVSYNVAANTGGARSTTLTVAGRPYTLSQAGATTTTAPTAPSSPSPASGATAVSTAPTLRWTCSGASSYTVRLGTSNPPPQAAAGVTSTSYTPATLTAGRTYYWQVVGTSATGSTAGPVWSFSTATTTTAPTTPPPSPWTPGDIGSVGLAGSAGYSNGVFTVTGSGAGTAGTADAFQFVRRPLTGLKTIVARLTSEQATNAGAGAGIMMREGRGGVTAGSAHVALVVSPNGSIALVTRSSAGSSTKTVATRTQAAPVWLRLTRTNRDVTASISANGTTWSTVGSARLSLTSQAVFGLAVASSSTTLRNTSTFDNVTVK